ncbi:MAG: hypothetical protein WCO29_24360 [Nostocales cyanobacterium ELA583]|jgi:hypothetical protein
MFQTDPPLAAKETLPTMYDLPSEDPEERGLPDQIHAELLSQNGIYHRLHSLQQTGELID